MLTVGNGSGGAGLLGGAASELCMDAFGGGVDYEAATAQEAYQGETEFARELNGEAGGGGDGCDDGKRCDD